MMANQMVLFKKTDPRPLTAGNLPFDVLLSSVFHVDPKTCHKVGKRTSIPLKVDEMVLHFDLKDRIRG